MDWRATALNIYILHLDSTCLGVGVFCGAIVPTAATGLASDSTVRVKPQVNGGCNSSRIPRSIPVTPSLNGFRLLPASFD